MTEFTMHFKAAAIGVACAASLAIGGRCLVGVLPEWVAQVMWLVVVLGGSALCGFGSPQRAWRWGAIIVARQPPCVFLLLLVVGELARSLSSIGGMVAGGILTALMAVIGPIAALASQPGARRALGAPRPGTAP